jgi:hypothetical protein
MNEIYITINRPGNNTTYILTSRVLSDIIRRDLLKLLDGTMRLLEGRQA